MYVLIHKGKIYIHTLFKDNMQNVIMYKKGEDSFIRWIKKRIKNNLNFIGLFQGATGIGKTWSAISIACQIEDTFEPKQIVFDLKQLMGVINADWFRKKKWKIIIFDEPQISISNRNWQSTTNKLMNYLLSTFRHQNIILFFASPYSDFLDSQSMKLLHCIFECLGVNKKKKLSKIKPKIQQYNSHLKKTYQHPLYVIRNKKIKPLREWFISKPPQNLIDAYEKAKEEFTSNLNKEILNQIDKLSTDKKEEKNVNVIDKRKPLTDIQQKVMVTLANNCRKEACRLLNRSSQNISFHKRASEKKGYRVKEFRDI